MNDTIIRLSASNYVALAEYLAQSLRGQITPTPSIRIDEQSGHVIVLTWRMAGRQSLHLRLRASAAGLYAKLYEGDGAHYHGEGVRHSWSFYQHKDRRRLDELECSGVALTGDRDNPVGDSQHYPLHFDHPLVRPLPGYDMRTPNLLVNIVETAHSHLRRLRHI